MKKNIFIVLIIVIAHTASALTVKSVSHSDWSNPLTWTTGQIPTNPDTILVSHYVTITADLTINAPTVLVIENTGTLCGDYLLNVACGAKWYNHGAAFINRFILRYGANYCTITTRGTSTVAGCPSGSWSVVPPKGNMNIVPWTACKAPDTNWEVPNGITGGCTVGIKEYFNSNDISVYPNPAEDKINLEFVEAKSYSFLIKDISGRTVIKESESQFQKTEINFSELNSGIYFLEIKNGNNTLIRKIIKK